MDCNYKENSIEPCETCPKAIKDSLVNDDYWNLLEDGRCFCADCHMTAWDEIDDNLLAFTKDTENSGAQLLGVVIYG